MDGMINLRRGPVHRIVATEEEARVLMAQGYVKTDDKGEPIKVAPAGDAAKELAELTAAHKELTEAHDDLQKKFSDQGKALDEQTQANENLQKKVDGLVKQLKKATEAAK